MAKKIFFTLSVLAVFGVTLFKASGPKIDAQAPASLGGGSLIQNQHDPADGLAKKPANLPEGQTELMPDYLKGKREGEFLELQKVLVESGFDAEKFNAELAALLSRTPNGKPTYDQVVALFPKKAQGRFKNLILEIVKTSSQADEPVSVIPPKSIHLHPEQLAYEMNARDDDVIIHHADETLSIKKRGVK